MATPSDSLTAATNTFKTTFIEIQHDFLGYGQTLFFSLLIIACVLKFLEYSANKDVAETLPHWIKELLTISFFYTLMINLPWLSSLPNSAKQIGLSYLKKTDPSTIVTTGITMAAKILKPLNDAGILNFSAMTLIGVICAGVVVFCMVSIAVNVAVTLIVTQALISISPLFLAGGAFYATRQMARNAIDTIIGNSVKLLGYYLVIYAGNKTIDELMTQIAGTFDPKTVALDQYGLIIAVTTLYYAMAKTLPDQLAKLATGLVQDNRGTDIGTAAVALQKIASSLTPFSKMASSTIAAAAKNRTNTEGSRGANYQEIKSNSGRGGISAASKAATSAIGNLAKSTGGALANKYKDLASKDTGGASNPNAKSVSQRMNQSTKAQISSTTKK